MMHDDAATLTRFDDFLDRLVDGGRADTDGLDAPLVETVGDLWAGAQSVAADPAFAKRLRRSLEQRSEPVPVGPGAAAPLRVSSSPAARLIPTGSWWPRLELAAMVVVIGLVASVLVGGDIRHWFQRGSDHGGFLAAPSTPGSTPAAEESVAILFLIDRSGSMSYDPLGGTAKLEMEKETIRRAVAAMPVGTT
ncbi:MAG TPA: hypothetical protein VKB09_14500, partial [Thermomicrobiales bacterium]|nr:hypothetical protein [Thermomicrobiales bacterium]